MAEKDVKLIRNISKVKKIDSGFLLNPDSYDKYIAPFLFGESFSERKNRITFNSIDEWINQEKFAGGISSFVTYQGIAKNQEKDIWAPVDNTLRKLSRHSLEDIEKNDSNINLSEVLLPSDLVSILAGLSLVFLRHEQKNPYLNNFKFDFELIKNFISPSESAPEKKLLKEFGNADVILEEESVDEEKFFNQENGVKVEKLMQAVVKAALQYEASLLATAQDTRGFLSLSELKAKLTVVVSKKILEEFKEENKDLIEKIKKQNQNNDSLLEKTYEKIQTDVTEIINNNLSFFDNLLREINLKEFSNLGFYSYSQGGLFKFAENEGEKGINTTNIYLEFEENSVKTFLEKNNDNLVRTYLAPLLKEETEEIKTTDKEEAPRESDSEQQNEAPSSNFSVNKKIVIKQVQKELKDQNIKNEFTFWLIEQSENRINTTENPNRFDINNFGNLAGSQEALDNIDKKIDAFIDQNIEQIFQNQELIDNLKNLEIINDETNFVDNYFRTQWYQDFLGFVIEEVTKKADDKFWNEIVQNDILPVLVASEQTEVVEEEASQTDQVQSEAEQQPPTAETQTIAEQPPEFTDPQIQPTTSANVPPTSSFEENVEESSFRLTVGKLKSNTTNKIVNKETAYATEIVLAQLFTLNGIDRSLLTEDFIDKIRNDIRQEVLNTDFDKVLLAALSTQRSKLLYQNILPKILTNYKQEIQDIYSQYQTTDSYKALSNTEKEKFINSTRVYFERVGIRPLQLLDTQEILSIEIQNKVGRDNDFVLKSNLKNTAENYYIIFGDNLDFIKNINPNLLKLELGIPTNQDIPDELIEKYRQIIINYISVRGKELAAEQEEDSAQKALLKIEEADLKKLKDGDTTVYSKFFGVLSDTKKAVKEKTAEVVAGGFDATDKSVKKKYLDDLKREIAFEELLANAANDDQRAEIIKLNNQINLINSQVDEYNKQQIVIANYLRIVNEEENKNSFRENIYSERNIEESPLGTNPLAQAIDTDKQTWREKLNDFLYRGTKDEDEGEKAKKRASKALQRLQKLSKGVNGVANLSLEKMAVAGLAAASNFVIPGAGVVVHTMARMMGDRTFLALTGMLATIVAGGLWYLASNVILPFLGSFFGPTLGGAFGGGALPSVNSQFFSNTSGRSGFGGGSGAGASAVRIQSPLVQYANNMFPNAAGAAEAATSTGLMAKLGALSSGIGVGFTAPLIGLVFIVFISIQTIFIIHSAFLIPIPQSRTKGSVGSGAIIVNGRIECLVLGPAGHIKDYTSNNVTYRNVSLDWNERDLQLLERSLTDVLANSYFRDLVCAKGDVILYKWDASPFGYGGWAMSDSSIGLYERAFGTLGAMKYTIIHELGHIVDHRNPGLQSGFASIKTDLSCYTYPAGCFDYDKNGVATFKMGEAFAEAFPLYTGSMRDFNFKEKYPDEYNYMRDYIFGGVEY